MQNTTTTIEDVMTKDGLAIALMNIYCVYEMQRQPYVQEKKEIQNYIFATDTTKTTNQQLPWKNKTTLPKLTQIRDNLYANYMAALFPKECWLDWEADNEDDQSQQKAEIIEGFMTNVIEQPTFKNEIGKIVLDYIDNGNAFAKSDWLDDSHVIGDGSQGEKVGYVGPIPQRISFADILFNNAATSFSQTGKFIRSLYTLGDFKKRLDATVTEDNIERVEALFKYFSHIRRTVASGGYADDVKDQIFNVSGFSNFKNYLTSNYIEVITYYGDWYDVETDKLYRNSIVTIADRHKVVNITENASELAGDRIFHVGWRIRPDSILAMGPLDNLVGMQYRIDHLENLKADIFDLIAAPPLKIKGTVEDFTWKPFGRIHVGDDGDVEVLAPEVNALSANLDIQNLMQQMEEMAGSPKEAMGFRTPGEKTMYEVQRLENAAARIFLTKIKQFEEQILEPLLNDMLEMARRKLDSTTIRMFDAKTNAVLFTKITKDDLQGSGRIRPMAARHFAQKAELVQNLTNFFGSSVLQTTQVGLHFSSEKMAKMFEEVLDIEKYKLVQPYVALIEKQEAAQLEATGQEQTMMQAGAPSGMTPEDYTPNSMDGVQ